MRNRGRGDLRDGQPLHCLVNLEGQEKQVQPRDNGSPPRRQKRFSTTLPQGHPQVGLVSKRKRGGTNTVKASDYVVEGSEGVGKRSRSSGGEEGVPQQESVITVKIHNDLEGDI